MFHPFYYLEKTLLPHQKGTEKGGFLCSKKHKTPVFIDFVRFYHLEKILFPHRKDTFSTPKRYKKGGFLCSENPETPLFIEFLYF